MRNFPCFEGKLVIVCMLREFRNYISLGLENKIIGLSLSLMTNYVNHVYFLVTICRKLCHGWRLRPTTKDRYFCFRVGHRFSTFKFKERFSAKKVWWAKIRLKENRRSSLWHQNKRLDKILTCEWQFSTHSKIKMRNTTTLNGLFISERDKQLEVGNYIREGESTQRIHANALFKKANVSGIKSHFIVPIFSLGD